MPNYQVVSQGRHGNKRWLRFSSYAHAEREAVMPLSGAELPKAMMTYPIAFIQQESGFVPVAMLNVLPGKNLFVVPGGRWAVPYVPAACRSYPFILGKSPDGQQMLCIDEDSGLLADGPDGEAFFDDQGQPAKAMLEVFDFLRQLEQNRQATLAAVAVLAKHALIQPWSLTVQGPNGEQQSVAGLFRVDEAALNQLPAEALAEVRAAGGLLVAYCQLLSMQHLPLLGKLAEAHAQAAQRQQAQVAAVPAGDLNLEFLNKSETISFGGLGS